MDLYTLLMSYAHKHRSPRINIAEFVKTLTELANWKADVQPEWRDWTVGVRPKVLAGIGELVNSGKCSLEMEGKIPVRILLLNFYPELLKTAYENPDGRAAGLPFPNQKSMGVRIPQDQLRVMDILALEEYMKSPQETELPILDIRFPDSYGNALILAPQLPQGILEVSMLKVQRYMQNSTNKDFYISRLKSQLAGKEIILRNTMDRLEEQPGDCIDQIKAAGEFACLFWPTFANQIRLELAENALKNNGLSPLEQAAQQAVYFIQFFVGYYYSKANRDREREAALTELAANLTKPPYYFTMMDILDFKDSHSRLLANRYKQEDLDAFIRDKTAFPTAEGEAAEALPEMFMFSNISFEQIFIRTDKIFLVVAKFVEEARIKVRKNIEERWLSILQEYQSEPAMENDQEFDRLLDRCTRQLTPMLMCFLRDKKLSLIRDEMEITSEGSKDRIRLYNDSGKMSPLTTLLRLNRKDLLAKLKSRLPFWYTNPVLFRIIVFFKNLRKSKRHKSHSGSAEKSAAFPAAERSSSPQTLAGIAQTYLRDNIPDGYTLESYLHEMEDRWRKVVSRDSRDQMVKDVQDTIKKKMRSIIDVWGVRQPNANTIGDIADSIIHETQAIQDLDGTNAVRSYVSIYISSLLKNWKK
ncbi:hypothetical protein AGMMS49546_14440 [Spirochaetia bacterium]|nr:hypothetical protein AGMMS49546_14440 [Spirochaetia bacterium]